MLMNASNQKLAIDTLRTLMFLESIPTTEEANQLVNMLNSVSVDVALLKMTVDEKIKEHTENHHGGIKTEVRQ